jgi:hypothetical protein
MLCDKDGHSHDACSQSSPISYLNKIESYDITEIVLKVALCLHNINENVDSYSSFN